MLCLEVQYGDLCCSNVRTSPTEVPGFVGNFWQNGHEQGGVTGTG